VRGATLMERCIRKVIRQRSVTRRKIFPNLGARMPDLEIWKCCLLYLCLLRVRLGKASIAIQ